MLRELPAFTPCDPPQSPGWVQAFIVMPAEMTGQYLHRYDDALTVVAA